MSTAQKNITALQSKPLFSEFIINQINNTNKKVDFNFIESINKYESVNIEDELSEIDFDKNINFIFYGFYEIEFIEIIIKRMSKLSTLTIFEKEIEIIIYMFGHKDISDILADPRVILITGEKENVGVYVNKRMMIRDFGYNLPRIKFISSNYMKQHHPNYIKEISHYLISHAKYIASSLGNDINDMLEGFDHSIDNMPNLLTGQGINNYKDKYKGVPAIIVSAGPSLDKNIEYLKQAYGKALILTVDTTVKKVLDLGVIPDIVSTIERPKSMYSIFYEGIEIPAETVFVGPSVVSKQIIDDFSRFIFTGRQGEPPVKAIAEALDYDSLEIGMSCAHIPFAFAEYVGADPIVFIGQDLAFSDEGHTHFGEASDVTKEGAKKLDLVQVEGNNGKTLVTNKIYHQFLLWFQNQISQMKGTKIINATEGGAKIEGTTLMTFESVINKYCREPVNHLSSLYDELDNLKLDEIAKNKKVENFLRGLVSSCELIEEKVLDKKDQLLSIEGDLNVRKTKFYEFRNEIDIALNENYVLNFLFQTITLKYNRSFNSYSNSLTKEDWNKLKAEGLRYYDLLKQVSSALKMRFSKYLVYINDQLENKKSHSEDEYYDKGI